MSEENGKTCCNCRHNIRVREEDGRYICDYGDCIDFGLITDGEWCVEGVIAWMPLPEPYKASRI